MSIFYKVIAIIFFIISIVLGANYSYDSHSDKLININNTKQ